MKLNAVAPHRHADMAQFGIFPEISSFVAFSQYADSYSLEYELIQPKNDMPTVERQQNSLSGLA